MTSETLERLCEAISDYLDDRDGIVTSDGKNTDDLAIAICALIRQHNI